MPEMGDLAPDFELPSTSGDTVRLSKLRGKTVVLYFYPKDNTPGCTTEACDFRDNMARLTKEDVVVLGVSKDSIASHTGFRAKYSLPFDLLSDAGNTVASLYGAYGEKTMYGKKVLGTIRSTFLIDPKGRIAQRWSPVKVLGHVDAVLAAIRGEAPLARPAQRKVKTGAKGTAKKTPTKKAAKKTPAKKAAPRRTVTKKTIKKK